MNGIRRSIDYNNVKFYIFYLNIKHMSPTTQELPISKMLKTWSEDMPIDIQ
jgi:hypothetical protein